MPATPWRAAWCHNLVTSRLMKGYCEQRAKLRSWGNYQRQQGNITQRGYGHEWRKLRAVIGYLCQVCKANGRLKEANQIDHILSKGQGGNDDPSNLQSICMECHKEKTAKDNGQD